MNKTIKIYLKGGEKLWSRSERKMGNQSRV